MPATLGHIGIQTLLTRGILRDADIKWIWAACVIPDLPWILQRAISGLASGVNLVDLRLYVVVQGTLLFCLLLSGGLASLSRKPGRSFLILAVGCVLHLLLDATQTKWANGVLLFAPAEWAFVNFGWYWPEDFPSAAMIVLGVMVAACAFSRRSFVPVPLLRPSRVRMGASMVLIGVYLVMPPVFVASAEKANLHYAQLLRPMSERAGEIIEFDRSDVRRTPDGAVLHAWSGETFALVADDLLPIGTVSLQGVFVDQSTIAVSDIHLHPKGLRDFASYVGLALIALWWMFCLARNGGRSARGRTSRSSG